MARGSQSQGELKKNIELKNITLFLMVRVPSTPGMMLDHFQGFD